MIFLKSPREIALMREAGRLVAQAHVIVKEKLRAGMTTADLDQYVDKFITDQNCIASFKGYRGFPAASCISVNEEVVHGIPGSRRIEEGDIVKVDIGIIYKGFHGDSVWSYTVGAVDAEKQKLLEVTEKTLYAGIDQAWPNKTLGDLGHAMQTYAEGAGYTVNREYGGHGVGQRLHEDPSVPNFGTPGQGIKLRVGMVIAIEPIVHVKDWRTRVLADNWTVVGLDAGLSAQYEHTVAITENGPEIMTTL